MKRVTYDGNFCDISMCTGFNCSRPCDQRKSWERLKAIEDILGDDYDLDRLREAVEKQAEYEQFMEKWKQVAEIAGAVKKVGAERAAELVEADREGRCVVLPCKVGTPVYIIQWHIGCAAMDDESYKFIDDFTRPFRIDMLSEFGKTVFLSREAAEVALKGD